MIVHYEPDAATVGECRECSGLLRLVEDAGVPRPIDAQCERCGVLTGVARDWTPREPVRSWVEPDRTSGDIGW